jgi:putative DNA primase/helicase
MTAKELAERLAPFRQIGKNFRVHCPAHDDGAPSLDLSDGDTCVLLVCRAGCDQESVIDAVCAKAGIERRDLVFRECEPTHRRIVVTYDYHTAEGTLLFQVVRYAPKNFRQRRPNGRGGWSWTLDGIQPVLYHLPEVLNAVKTGRRVRIVEGEKDSDNLRALGLIATTNPMGAGKWRESYAEMLHGADVVVIPDNNAPGCKHAQHIARSLHSIAARIRVVELPNLPEKGDVSDWLAAGGTREALEALVTATPL